MCKCSHLKPLQMFIRCGRNTFLIRTIHALVSQVCHKKTDSLLCAVTGLAAFNIGGVTIHRLLQLPIEHKEKTTGYWRLGRDALKVMRSSLSQLCLLIDEVSMVSNLNLAYVHLRLDEIFARDEWFRGTYECTVCGRHLATPIRHGAPVFDRITNKSVASKLGCMTSVNIWQDTVESDELTIYERQRKDQVFSSMLDEVLAWLAIFENHHHSAGGLIHHAWETWPRQPLKDPRLQQAQVLVLSLPQPAWPR